MSESEMNKATKSREEFHEGHSSVDSPASPDLTSSALHAVGAEEDCNSAMAAESSTVDENGSIAMDAESSNCVNGHPQPLRKIKINRRSFYTYINSFNDENNEESKDNDKKLPAAKASEGQDDINIPASSSSRMIPTSYARKKLVENNTKEDKSAELESRLVRFSTDCVTVNAKNVKDKVENVKEKVENVKEKVEPPKKKHKPITWP